MTKPISLYTQLSGGHKPPPRRVLSAELVSHRLTMLERQPYKVYDVRGIPTKCYTIGVVAKVLGKSQVTLRSWEQKKWMLPPNVRTTAPSRTALANKTNKGRRLYTQDQVEYLVAAYEACYLDDPARADWEQFREKLKLVPRA